MFLTSISGEKMKNKKVAMAGVSLSEACALSENHPLSEALSPLSELGESGGESAQANMRSARHQLAQQVVCLLSR